MIKVIIFTIFLVFCLKQTQSSSQNNNSDNNADKFGRLFPSVRRIWVYWDRQIEKAPLLVQMCLQKMRMVSSQEHWQLTLMTDDNLHQYISNYESEFMTVKRKMKHPEWKAGVADLIRLFVLEQHGGVWFDMSTILIQGMEWMNNLIHMPYLLANSQIDNGQQPDVLIPYLNYYQSLSQQRNAQGKLSKLLPGYQAWFIAANKPHLSLIKQWKQYYIKHITQQASMNRKQQIEQQYYAKFLKGEYLNVDKSINEIIQDKQRQIDQALGLFEQRKNANKELNIVGLHGEYGPFALYLKLIPDLDMAFTHTIDQLEQQYLLTVNFFIKFTNQQRNHYENKINKLIQIYTQYHNFQNYIASKPPLQQCNEVVFIVEESIFGRLIKKNKLAQTHKVNLISQQQNLQWRKYCQQYKKRTYINSYPIVSNSSQIQHFWDWLYYFQIIDNQMRISIINYFQNVNWMGIISIDIKELYYWKKLYQEQENYQIQDQNEKNTNTAGEQDIFQIVNSNSLNQSSKQQTVRNNNNLRTEKHDINVRDNIINRKNKKWSEFTYQQQFQIFLQILIAKIQPVTIKFWYLTNEIRPYLHQLIPLVIYGFLLFNLIIIPLKFRLRYFKYSIKIFRHLALGKQMDEETQIHWIQVKKSLNINIVKKILVLCWKVLVFALKLILCFLIGIIFVGFQIMVILKFIRVCLDGDIYNQQIPLLTIMSVQIIFRQIIYKCLSVNSWAIPGISLQFLYRMFLPIYHVSLGRCLVAFGEKRQQWNFGLMFTICLMYPIVVAEIEHQARKVLQVKEGLDDNGQLISKVVMKILSLLANATSIIQKIILGFLLLSYFMPNILYVYYGEEHLMKLIVVKLTKAGPILLGILLVFYVNELFNFGKQIYHQCKQIVLVKTIVLKTTTINGNKSVSRGQVYNTTKRQDEQKGNDGPYMRMKGEATIIQMQLVHQYSARQDHAIDNRLQTSQQPQRLESEMHQQANQEHPQQQRQYETYCKWKPRLFKQSVITMVHLVKYAINLYLIMNLCIDPYPQRVYKNVLQIWKPKVMQVLFLLIINWQVEKVIDELCLKIEHIYSGYQFGSTKNNMEIKRSNQDYFRNHNWCVASMGLFVFQLLRLQMFQYIFQYFNVIDKGRLDLRWEVEKLFPLYKEQIIYYTFAGYWLMRIIESFFTQNGNRIKNYFVKTVQTEELKKITFYQHNQQNQNNSRPYFKRQVQTLQEQSSNELNKLEKSYL